MGKTPLFAREGPAKTPQTCLARDREATPEVAQRTLEEKEEEEDVM